MKRAIDHHSWRDDLCVVPGPRGGGPSIREGTKTANLTPALTRRDFLQSVAGAAAVTLAGRLGAAVPDDRKMIAIQIDASGLVDEGVDRLLDEVQRRASVNTVMIDTLWFASDVTRAGLEKSKTRGHTIDPSSPLIGGRVGFIHPQYYKDT